MNQEADTTEVVEAIEHLRRNYRRPFPPVANPPDQHTQTEEAKRTNPNAATVARTRTARQKREPITWDMAD